MNKYNYKRRLKETQELNKEAEQWLFEFKWQLNNGLIEIPPKHDNIKKTT